MSTYTPVSKAIGATGATGAAGISTTITAYNVAVAAAVTTALAVTGLAPQSIVVSPANLVIDSIGSIYSIMSTISYTVIS